MKVSFICVFRDRVTRRFAVTIHISVPTSCAVILQLRCQWDEARTCEHHVSSGQPRPLLSRANDLLFVANRKGLQAGARRSAIWAAWCTAGQYKFGGRRGRRVAPSPACFPAGRVTMPAGTPLGDGAVARSSRTMTAASGSHQASTEVRFSSSNCRQHQTTPVRAR